MIHDAVKITLWLAILMLSGHGVQAQSYTDVAGQYNLSFTNQTLTANGGGVSLADFDNDGLDDITLATGMGDSLVFFRNTGKGITKIPSLVNHTAEAQHVIWVDFDNDGDQDLYVSSNLSANKLYRNDQSSGFTDVSASAGLSTSITETYGACWGDINKDGWLDLYEANQLNFGTGHNVLYLSNGAGGFTDITTPANAADSTHYAFAPAFLDYDKDGWPDLFIANDRSASTTLLRNLGDSSFTDVSAQTGVNHIIDGMSATIGDYDNNGWLDIYATNTSAGNRLFRNNGNNSFTEMADSWE
ncbi:MAG: VCBS repeat-containing protein [Owenweeksia sp.]|nr:VCBS repeat-containing protein [Owenweeksia sp.]